MKIYSENDKIINELYLELMGNNIPVEKEQIVNQEQDKKPMAGGFLYYLSVAGDFITVSGGIITAINFLRRKYPDFIAYITSEKVTMTLDEYMSLSDSARRAMEENDIRVEIRKK